MNALLSKPSLVRIADDQMAMSIKRSSMQEQAERYAETSTLAEDLLFVLACLDAGTFTKKEAVPVLERAYLYIFSQAERTLP